jgi:sirohydrochlorin cobaltochelatase
MKSTQYRNVAVELMELDEKVNALLPPRYQHCYTSVSPNSMGSAGLTYGPDGKVVWDQIWSSFCDLAMAGGPPHRGKLLEPVSEAEVAAEPERYRDVVTEIDRAVGLTTGLRVVNGYLPGWVGVKCASPDEAVWLQVAITAENVSARRRGLVLQLPAGPAFRVEKEIKNVVVALAKACHYWDGHLTEAQQSLATESHREAATPDEAAANLADYEAAMREIEKGLHAAGVPTLPERYVGWIGVETAGEEDAVWLLRAILVERVLARREGKVLYFPVAANTSSDQAVEVARVVGRAWDLRAAASPRRGVWKPSGGAK